MSERLYYMHHAPAPRRPHEIVGSGTDRELDEYGEYIAKNQAERVKRLIGSGALAAIDRIVTSPLKRAVQTTEIIAVTNNLDIAVDERLKAQDFGVLEGMTFDEINRDSELAKNMWDHIPPEERTNHRAPMAESNGDLVERVREARSDLQEWDGSQLVITHGSVIDAVISLHEDIRLDAVEGASRKFEGRVIQDTTAGLRPLGRLGEQFDHIPGTREAIEREDVEDIKRILRTYLTNPHMGDQEKVHLTKLIAFL